MSSSLPTYLWGSKEMYFIWLILSSGWYINAEIQREKFTNVPSLGLVNVSGMPEKIPESCSQLPVITDIQEMCYASGLSLFHLVTETVFNSGTGMWVQAGLSKCALVMHVWWELNRKQELAQLFEWQGIFPEGYIQSIMVLNTDCCKLCSFMETPEALFWKNLGLGMDWFTLLVVNSERGGDDLVTVKEKKQWEGEDEVVSDDTSVHAPFQMGVEHSLFLLWLLPRESSSTFSPQ